mgnify:FL=1
MRPHFLAALRSGIGFGWKSAIAAEAPLTDDCSAVERLGKVVYLIDGDEENLKITTPVDLVIAEAILAEREGR